MRPPPLAEEYGVLVTWTNGAHTPQTVPYLFVDRRPVGGIASIRAFSSSGVLKLNNPWSVGESRGEKGKESMSTLRRVLVRLGSVGTLLGAGGVFFVSGLARKTTTDLDEEVRAAFEAWARSGSEVASSALRSADQD
jgi:hypothetical protein